MIYTTACDVATSSDISIVTTASGDFISCPPGTLLLIEYSPSISELTQTDRLDLVALFFLFLLLGYIGGLSGKAIISFIHRSLGWS